MQALANSRSLPRSIVQRIQIVLVCGAGETHFQSALRWIQAGILYPLHQQSPCRKLPWLWRLLPQLSSSTQPDPLLVDLPPALRWHWPWLPGSPVAFDELRSSCLDFHLLAGQTVLTPAQFIGQLANRA